MLVRAFVPSHITAFFVPRFNENYLLAGSLGAGVNLNRGITIIAGIEEGVERQVRVAFNGKPVKRKSAVISYSVAEEIVPRDFPGEVEIWEYFDFPNGYGFGNSGGGALGTALALSYAFKNKTMLQAAQIAHKHEVLNRGGLGDVIAQLTGGVEIRIKEGAPGVGVVDNIFFEDYKVLAVPLGRLSTREVLEGDMIKLIEREGMKALEKLLMAPNVENMMRLSREFAENTGLLEGELLEIARELDKVLKLPSSMVMLGKSLFAFLRGNEIPKAQETLDELSIERYEICEVWKGKPEVGRWFGSVSKSYL
ncbi:pantoate kinase [Palaeococcus sp. (in: euryarchaeotes)]